MILSTPGGKADSDYNLGGGAAGSRSGNIVDLATYQVHRGTFGEGVGPVALGERISTFDGVRTRNYIKV